MLGKHLAAWVMVVGLQVVAATALLSPSYTAQSIVKEVSQLKKVFGASSTNKIIKRSQTLYAGLFLDSALGQATYDVINTDEHRLNSARGTPVAGIAIAKRLTNKWAQNAWLGGYKTILRLNAVALWIPALLPFLIAAIIDGVMVRRRKEYTFGYTNPVRYNLVSHLMVMTIGLCLLLFTIPTAIHPLALPLLAVVSIVPISMLTANFQAGR